MRGREGVGKEGEGGYEKVLSGGYKNSHGNVKNSTRNIINNTVVSMCAAGWELALWWSLRKVYNSMTMLYT